MRAARAAARPARPQCPWRAAPYALDGAKEKEGLGVGREQDETDREQHEGQRRFSGLPGIHLLPGDPLEAQDRSEAGDEAYEREGNHGGNAQAGQRGRQQRI